MNSIPSQPSCADGLESGALPVDIAKKKILEAIDPVSGNEVLPVAEALHRILEKSVTSALDVPGHTNAAVDGFAVSGCDLPARGHVKAFRIIGQALAGKPYKDPVGSDQTVSIMTGAVLPAGADTVLMQEHVERQGNRILVGDQYRPGENVRRAGEDIRRGQVAVEKGRYLLPPDLGLIASLGCLEITVKRRIRVALLSTGNEILSAGAPHEAGKIYDSNRFSLIGALHKLPVDIIDYGILRDDPVHLQKTFEEASKRCDAIISSGGVSVGEADFTRQVLGNIGEIEFWKVAIKPGRPLAFGKIGDACLFGLPGNPVAVLVTFYQFVLPALFKLAGANQAPLTPTLPARVLQPLRKKPGRTEFQRGILTPTSDGHWEVKPTGKQGSGILTSMTRANCFIILEQTRGRVQQGDWVQVLPFSVLM